MWVSNVNSSNIYYYYYYYRLIVKAVDRVLYNEMLPNNCSFRRNFSAGLEIIGSIRR